MTQAATRLYTQEMLTLALRLAEYPLTPDFLLTGSARSPTCGSYIGIGLALRSDGMIESCGMQVQACAVGQAACAIFADGVQGLGLADLLRAEREMESWLAGRISMPSWPGLSAIEQAQEFAGRHGAIMLPWRAALAALQ